jgi:glucan 1,3-beta-glucosidase
MRRFLLPVLMFVLVAATCFQYWHWRGRPVPLPDLPGARFQCLSYSPFEGSASPLDRDFDVPRPVIARDMEVLKKVTGCLRTYSAIKVQGDVTRIAHEHGLKTLQGIWISGTPEDNEEEVTAAIDLARMYPDTVKALIVGNEVLLRREMTGETLARIIRRVKAATGLPVLYADVPHFFKKEPAVVAAVDTLAIHILPYWDDPEPVSIAEVQKHVAIIVEDMRRTFPGKPLMIGEIGWPSEGRTRGASVPSLVNQARFVREFVLGANRLGIDYNLIEAIDQPWKRVPEGTVGGYWGIFTADRELKFPLTGPVSEWPHWRAAFAVSLGIMAAFFAYGLSCGRIGGAVRWIAFALLAGATGISLVHLYDHIRVSSLTAAGWVFGAYMAALTILAAVALTARMEGRIVAGAAAFPRVLGRFGDRERWRPARWIGAGFWIAALPAAMLALAIGFDGRHRDLPIMGLWLPGLAVLILCRGIPGNRPRREEASLTLILTTGALMSFDGLRNVEMLFWSATVLLFAAPGWRDIRSEVKFLISRPVEHRGADEAKRDGDGGKGG